MMVVVVVVVIATVVVAEVAKFLLGAGGPLDLLIPIVPINPEVQPADHFFFIS